MCQKPITRRKGEGKRKGTVRRRHRVRAALLRHTSFSVSRCTVSISRFFPLSLSPLCCCYYYFPCSRAVSFGAPSGIVVGSKGRRRERARLCGATFLSLSKIFGARYTPSSNPLRGVLSFAGILRISRCKYILTKLYICSLALEVIEKMEKP